MPTTPDLHTEGLATVGSEGVAPSPPSKASEVPSWRKVTVAICAGVVSLVAVEAAAPGRLGGDKVYAAAEKYPDGPLQYDLTEAPTLNNEAVQHVWQRLFERPEDPALGKRPGLLAAKSLVHPGEYTSVLESAVDYQIRKEIADRYGLTVFDPTATIKVLLDDIFREKGVQMPSKQFMGIVNEFLANYGAHIFDSNIHPETAYAHNMVEPSPALLDSPQVRESLVDLVENIATMPLELAKLAGENMHINLAVNTPGKHMQVGGYADLSSHRIILNANYPGFGLLHEYWHFINVAIYGGVSAVGNDRTFLSLTGNYLGDKWDTSKPNTQLVYDDFQVTRGETTALVAESARLGNPNCMTMAVAADYKLQVLGRNVMFITPYSRSNMPEQKTELGEEMMLSDAYRQMLDPSTVALNTQLAYQMAMLYTYRPRLAMYLMSMAQRPDRAQSPIDLCR